jgi:hypothetical protein
MVVLANDNNTLGLLEGHGLALRSQALPGCTDVPRLSCASGTPGAVGGGHIARIAAAKEQPGSLLGEVPSSGSRRRADAIAGTSVGPGRTSKSRRNAVLSIAVPYRRKRKSPVPVTEIDWRLVASFVASYGASWNTLDWSRRWDGCHKLVCDTSRCDYSGFSHTYKHPQRSARAWGTIYQHNALSRWISLNTNTVADK